MNILLAAFAILAFAAAPISIYHDYIARRTPHFDSRLLPSARLAWIWGLWIWLNLIVAAPFLPSYDDIAYVCNGNLLNFPRAIAVRPDWLAAYTVLWATAVLLPALGIWFYRWSSIRRQKAQRLAFRKRNGGFEAAAYRLNGIAMSSVPVTAMDSNNSLYETTAGALLHQIMPLRVLSSGELAHGPGPRPAKPEASPYNLKVTTYDGRLLTIPSFVSARQSLEVGTNNVFAISLICEVLALYRDFPDPSLCEFFFFRTAASTDEGVSITAYMFFVTYDGVVQDRTFTLRTMASYFGKLRNTHNPDVMTCVTPTLDREDATSPFDYSYEPLLKFRYGTFYSSTRSGSELAYGDSPHFFVVPERRMNALRDSRLRRLEIAVILLLVLASLNFAMLLWKR